MTEETVTTGTSTSTSTSTTTTAEPKSAEKPKQRRAADYPVITLEETVPAGYAPTLEFATVHDEVAQAYAAPHEGQTPAKVWVILPWL